jgi:uncharacterized protein (TIGR00730 family)
MDHTIQSICVYCGSADDLNSVYLDAAAEMGRLIAKRNVRLVYGAGKTGLMGALAEGALKAGGEVIGVAPKNLNTLPLIHQNLTKLEIVPDIHARKARMYALADAFIALPGGYGTLDELFETLTWAQIGLHTKPVGLLNTIHYYDPLLEMLEKARQEKFIFDEHLLLFMSDPDPQALLDRLFKFNFPGGLSRWVERG